MTWSHVNEANAIEHVRIIVQFKNSLELMRRRAWALVPHHTSKDVKSYKIISDLKKMKDGWDGPDSFAPSPNIISALIEVFTILKLEEEVIKPIEVDGNGSLVMIWKSDGNVYSIDIYRDARTVFTITDTSKKKSKSITLDSSNYTEVEAQMTERIAPLAE